MDNYVVDDDADVEIDDSSSVSVDSYSVTWLRRGHWREASLSLDNVAGGGASLIFDNVATLTDAGAVMPVELGTAWQADPSSFSVRTFNLCFVTPAQAFWTSATTRSFDPPTRASPSSWSLASTTCVSTRTSPDDDDSELKRHGAFWLRGFDEPPGDVSTRGRPQPRLPQ